MAEDVAKRWAKREEPAGVVVQAPFFRRLGRKVGVCTAPIAGPPRPAPRPPHVARMLALAHEIVRTIRDGTFADGGRGAGAGVHAGADHAAGRPDAVGASIQEEFLFAILVRDG